MICVFILSNNWGALPFLMDETDTETDTQTGDGAKNGVIDAYGVAWVWKSAEYEMDVCGENTSFVEIV